MSGSLVAYAAADEARHLAADLLDRRGFEALARRLRRGATISTRGDAGAAYARAIGVAQHLHYAHNINTCDPAWQAASSAAESALAAEAAGHADSYWSDPFIVDARRDARIRRACVARDDIRAL